MLSVSPRRGNEVCSAKRQWHSSRAACLSAYRCITEVTRGATAQGFITAEAGPQGNVSISQLPPTVRLDAPWPLLKVAQQAQPHHLTYYPEARLYTLTVSRQVKWTLGLVLHRAPT